MTVCLFLVELLELRHKKTGNQECMYACMHSDRQAGIEIGKRFVPKQSKKCSLTKTNR